MKPEPTEILVIDDDRDLRDAMSFILEGEGFQVRTAENGRIALELLASYHPAVILLDMRMPVMDGWQFMEEYKRRLRGEAAKIIVFTAAENAGKRAQEVGVPLYLSKPFDIDDVVKLVKRSLGEKR
ncbi:MAG: response regulator [Oligoflexia bacterium]|nr:response regulator [Oligoflexia bacterium]